MGSKSLWIGVALALVVLGGTMAEVSAQAFEAGGWDAPGSMMGARPLRKAIRENIARLKALRADLNLTPEQKRDIAIILRDNKAEIVDALKDVHEGRRRLLRAIRAENPSESAIRRAASAMTESIADASVLKARIRREVFETLTPEQRRMIDEVQEANLKNIDDALEELSRQG